MVIRLLQHYFPTRRTSHCLGFVSIDFVPDEHGIRLICSKCAGEP